MHDTNDDLLELADALRPALFHILRDLRRESLDAQSGVTPLQNYLMAQIRIHAGIGVSELAKRENLRGPTISGQIKTLESAGLVARQAEEGGDRRRSGLYLTAAGLELLERLRLQRNDWLASRLARLSLAGLDALRAALEPLRELSR